MFVEGRPVTVSTLIHVSPQEEDNLRSQALEYVTGISPASDMLDHLREVRLSPIRTWVPLDSYPACYRFNKPSGHDRRRWEHFLGESGSADLFFVNGRNNRSTAVMTCK